RGHAECETLYRIAARRESEPGHGPVLPAERLVAARRAERLADHHRAVEGRVVALALVVLAGDRTESDDGAVFPAERFGSQMDPRTRSDDNGAVAGDALGEALEQRVARQVADAFERSGRRAP